MQEVKDPLNGEKWMILDEDELKMGFLAQCVEKLAEQEYTDVCSMFERLENANMTEGYILKHYNVLHSESIENTIEGLTKLLHRREKNTNYGNISRRN